MCIRDRFWANVPGTYTILAQLYSEDNLNGDLCDEQTISFVVEDCSAVSACDGVITGFQLNPQQGLSLIDLTGQSLCASDYDNHDVRIRANVSGTHQSLQFTITTPNGVITNTENAFTYDSDQFWANIPGTYTILAQLYSCLLYTSPSPRDATLSRMPSSA